MEWMLENVEKANQLYPNSFFIPSLKERKGQKKGDLVRLHFIINNPGEEKPRAERMWVEIKDKKLLSKKYIGILTNQPVFIKTLNQGDMIEFEPRHVARTIIKESNPLWLEIGEQMALVSKKCLEDRNIIRWMYKEIGDREEDSGWRIFAGDEDEEYNNDSRNIAIVNIYFLLDKDPTLLIPFKSKVGSAFERENIKTPWIEIMDWNTENE